MVNLIWAITQAFIVIGVIAAVGVILSHTAKHKKPPDWFTRWLDEQEKKFHDSEM